MTMAPTPKALYAAIDQTWRPAAIDRVGAWMVRTGGGGGSRVSAATLTEPAVVSRGDLAQAEDAMAARGQTPLVMVRDGEEALDALLADEGYAMSPVVSILAAPTAKLAELAPSPMTAILTAPRLARLTEIWVEGGLATGRMDVMDRVTVPKTHIIARHDDRPSGAVFVAVDGEIAMLHALEIRRDKRRLGLAQAMTARAAEWAGSQGASFLALQVERTNEAALALYANLGMEEICRYHYRLKT